MDLKNKIIEQIRTVYDPEIPINIYDLGLIYNIDIQEKNVKIEMTLTSPMCPVAGELPGWVGEAVDLLEELEHVEVHLVWDPPWGPEMLSEEAQLELGLI